MTTIRDRGTGPGTDAQHRDLGRITEARGFGFFIYAPRGSRLSGIEFGPYDTLAEAVQQIAAHMASFAEEDEPVEGSGFTG